MNPSMSMRTRLLLAVAVSCLCFPGVASALVPPDQDPFYRPPADLAARAPGTVLRSREVSLVGISALVTAKTYQLLYRTTDAHGQPIATVTTVVLPATPAPAARLVAFNQAYDSLTLACAPSYAMQSAPQPLRLIEDEQTTELLGRGWTITIPDYEGPDSQWTVGRLSGQAALDALRATERFAPAGLDVHTPTGMMGYSGGSIPGMWADGLWKSYAPELNLVGVSVGGLPANFYDAVHTIDGTPFFGTAFGVLVGINRAYPELDLYSLLNDRGKAEADKAATDAGGCAGSPTQAPFGHAADYTRGGLSAAQFAALPQVRKTLAKVAITSGPVFGAPAHLYHEANDELAPVKAADDLVAFNCRHGVAIDYVRDPIGEHVTGGSLYFEAGVQWLADRFDGKPAPTTCTGPTLPATPPVLHVKRRTLRVGRRTRLTFTATVDGQPLVGARVRLLRRSATTDTRGRATITVRPHAKGTFTARLKTSGTVVAKLTFHVRARTKH